MSMTVDTTLEHSGVTVPVSELACGEHRKDKESFTEIISSTVYTLSLLIDCTRRSRNQDVTGPTITHAPMADAHKQPDRSRPHTPPSLGVPECQLASVSSRSVCLYARVLLAACTRARRTRPARLAACGKESRTVGTMGARLALRSSSIRVQKQGVGGIRCPVSNGEGGMNGTIVSVTADAIPPIDSTH